jgi:serine/threonine-protein kinase
MSDDHSEIKLPKLPGPYQLLEQVGAGGLGRVFKAQVKGTNEIVAIKILHDEMLKRPEILGSFHKELLILSQMKHKNIVSYIEAKWDPPTCYVVTDYIEGWNGYRLLKEVDSLPPLVALCVLVQILQAVDHLHVHDIIHSDLTPGNILINKQGRVFLTDFGLSLVSDVDSSKGKKFGTPGFFSPEHIRRKALTEASDLYGAGLLLYQLISGKRLLPNSKDNEAVVKAMKKRDLSRLNMSKGNLEKAITSVIKKSISYYRFFRYSNAEDMIHDISVILKAYGVNYPRLAVWQFLSDSNLADKEFTDKNQPIYVKAK